MKGPPITVRTEPPEAGAIEGHVSTILTLSKYVNESLDEYVEKDDDEDTLPPRSTGISCPSASKTRDTLEEENEYDGGDDVAVVPGCFSFAPLVSAAAAAAATATKNEGVSHRTVSESTNSAFIAAAFPNKHIKFI